MDSSNKYLHSLPIDQHLEKIVESLRQHSNLVLTASPGAGKTTRLPPTIIKSTLLQTPNSTAVMLEPRRLAARAAASRIAEEQGWGVGAEVGYQVRFENKTSAHTRLQILTEGIFSRRMQSNPELKGVGCLILDEFHERSSQTDVALAMARELQELSRPDLKIVVMSATLETSKLSEFLGNCPIIEVPGLLHPVEVTWERDPQILTTQPSFYKRLAEVVREVLNGHRKSSGNILVFLPGVGEIATLRRELSPFCVSKNITVDELHGSLSLEQQTEVLKPSKQRKLILCTNIAESSLTVPGVATVIDCGLAKVMRQEGVGFAKLNLSRISKFSAAQRAGRSGREMQGYNIRLWNKQDEASMVDSEVPELLRSDLSETVLLLSSLGITDPKTFSWFERPNDKNLAAAQKSLVRLGAIDKTGHITKFGERLAKIPADPRISALLLKADEINESKLGARVAALLTEKDFVEQSELNRFAQSDSDLLARLQLLETKTLPDLVRRAERQFLELSSPSKQNSNLTIEDAIEQLLLSAFSDRLARRRNKSDLRAKMISGEGVRLHDQSLVKNAEFFICLEAFSPSGSNEMVITRASPISVEAIKKSFKSSIQTISRTLNDDGQLITEEYLAVEELPLEAPRRRGATAAEGVALLPQLFVENWNQTLDSQPAARRWVERLHFAKKYLPEFAWPEFDDRLKAEIAAAVVMGVKNLNEAAKKDLIIYFDQALSPDLRKTLSSQVPDGFTIPSGRYVTVDYSSAEQPTIEARLQEFFGWMDSPVIAAGRVKVRVQLLGPNYRPVQITSDLKGFWLSSYHDVRKELRARYPKHQWPEDPLNATAKQKPK